VLIDPDRWRFHVLDSTVLQVSGQKSANEATIKRWTGTDAVRLPALRAAVDAVIDRLLKRV
jgi:hypothetical protein